MNSLNHPRSFLRRENGSVSPMFAVYSLFLMGLSGAALEFGQGFSMKTELQAMLDASILNGADIYRKTSDPAQAQAAAQAMLEELLRKNGYTVPAGHGGANGNGSVPGPNNSIISQIGGSADFTFTFLEPLPEFGLVAGSLKKHVNTKLLSLIGMDRLELNVESNIVLTGNTLELALVLDVTGSMNESPSGDSQTKLEAMKSAAKDFLTIVMPGGATEGKSKVSLATFSEKVKLDADTAAAVTGQPKVRQVAHTTTTTTHSASTTNYEWTSKNTCKDRYEMLYMQQGQSQNEAQNNADDWCQRNSGILTRRIGDNPREYWSPQRITTTTTNTTYTDEYINPCFVERSGSGDQAYHDGAPTSGNGWTASYSSTPTADVNCPSTAPLIPLTKNRQQLFDSIDSLSGGGYTAGHIGTAWGWYTISQNWQSLWQGDSQPIDYGTRNHHKVIVIMTDGEYNRSYNGVSSTTQARNICTKMKETVVDQNGDVKAKVQVYTIGFGLGSNNTARQLLIDCASGADHFFFPYNGDDLRVAFNTIGAQLRAGTLGARIASREEIAARQNQQ